MKLNTKYWLGISILNLTIIALLGVVMRYKIGFEFPYFSQKNLQNAHSHFAFSGWITHSLYVLMIHFIQTKIPVKNYKQYKVIVISNLICSYGMLISFSINGYDSISIAFSTGTIIISCFFAYYLSKDLNLLGRENPSFAWFKAAVWFNIISSLGTFYLAYMLASKEFNENWYLAAVYFYLHFQYNGFFIFTCMGLAADKIQLLMPFYKQNKTTFRLFFTSFIPAYFLSTLWAKLPTWLYIIVVFASFLQVVAWVKFLIEIKNNVVPKVAVSKLTKNLFLFVAAAFTVKLLLQLGSTVPFVSKLAFGFRPIVIAYLHLVLLAVISVFLLSYMQALKLININDKLGKIGLVLFVLGVFLNELVLAIQGVASFSYFAIPMVNEILFVVSLFLLLSLIIMSISVVQFRSRSIIHP